MKRTKRLKQKIGPKPGGISEQKWMQFERRQDRICLTEHDADAAAARIGALTGELTALVQSVLGDLKARRGSGVAEQAIKVCQRLSGILSRVIPRKPLRLQVPQSDAPRVRNIRAPGRILPAQGEGGDKFMTNRWKKHR